MNIWRILAALGKSAWRDTRTLGSVQGNNLFYFAVLLSMQPESAAFIWFVMGVLMLVPAVTTPLAKLPELRLSLWPVSDGQRRALAPFTQPAMRAAPWLWRMPVLEVRQLLRTLDVYVALVIAASGTAYRFFAAKPDSAAVDVISMLVVLSLSTLAQNLFTLDGAARLRWRQASRRGFVHLWRKGRILLALTAILTFGLALPAAVAGMLACLAIGHHNSVLAPSESPAWRFSAGRFFPQGFLQVVASFACGISVARGDWSYLGLAALAYGLSLFLYGWILENS